MAAPQPPHQQQQQQQQQQQHNMQGYMQQPFASGPQRASNPAADPAYGNNNNNNSSNNMQQFGQQPPSAPSGYYMGPPQQPGSAHFAAPQATNYHQQAPSTGYHNPFANNLNYSVYGANPAPTMPGYGQPQALQQQQQMMSSHAPPAFRVPALPAQRMMAPQPQPNRNMRAGSMAPPGFPPGYGSQLQQQQHAHSMQQQQQQMYWQQMQQQQHQLQQQYQQAARAAQQHQQQMMWQQQQQPPMVLNQQPQDQQQQPSSGGQLLMSKDQQQQLLLVSSPEVDVSGDGGDAGPTPPMDHSDTALQPSPDDHANHASNNDQQWSFFGADPFDAHQDEMQPPAANEAPMGLFRVPPLPAAPPLASLPSTASSTLLRPAAVVAAADKETTSSSGSKEVEVIDLEDLDEPERASSSFRPPYLPPPRSITAQRRDYEEPEEVVETPFSRNLPPPSPWEPQNRAFVSKMAASLPSSITSNSPPPASSPRPAVTNEKFQQMLAAHPDLNTRLQSTFSYYTGDQRALITKVIETVARAAKEADKASTSKKAEEEKAVSLNRVASSNSRFSSRNERKTRDTRSLPRELEKAKARRAEEDVDEFDYDDEDDEDDVMNMSIDGDTTFDPRSLAASLASSASPSIFVFPGANGKDIKLDLVKAVSDFAIKQAPNSFRTSMGKFTRHVMNKMLTLPNFSFNVTIGCGKRKSSRGYKVLPEDSIRTLARFWQSHFKSPRSSTLPQLVESMSLTIRTFLSSNRRAAAEKRKD